MNDALYLWLATSNKVDPIGWVDCGKERKKLRSIMKKDFFAADWRLGI